MEASYESRVVGSRVVIERSSAAGPDGKVDRVTGTAETRGPGAGDELGGQIARVLQQLDLVRPDAVLAKAMILAVESMHWAPEVAMKAEMGAIARAQGSLLLAAAALLAAYGSLDRELDRIAAVFAEPPPGAEPGGKETAAKSREGEDVKEGLAGQGGPSDG